jgi:C4-dicarboxylate transporter, DctM subunit
LLSLMGCFLDGLAIMLLSVPLFFPVVIKLGYDPIWFGVIIIIACELAQITPPVGLNLYIIKDLAPKGTKTSDVIAGAAPYVLVVWVLFILLLFYPQIALWLPSLMKVG